MKGAEKYLANEETKEKWDLLGFSIPVRLQSREMWELLCREK